MLHLFWIWLAFETSCAAGAPLRMKIDGLFRRYCWRTLEKAKTTPYAQCAGDVDVEKVLQFAQTIEETHPVERELQR